MGLTHTLFGFRGRIKRSTWWLWIILTSLGFLVILVAVFMLALGSNPEDWEDQVLQNELVAVAVLALMAVSTWIGLALGAERVRPATQLR